jgi:hypothetical protein
MNDLLTKQLHAVLAEPALVEGLNSESSLRISAATLLRADSDEISATTAVGVLGRDDVDAFKAMVAEICDEFGLDARVRIHGGTFSVRFTRRPTEPGAPPRRAPG